MSFRSLLNCISRSYMAIALATAVISTSSQSAAQTEGTPTNQPLLCEGGQRLIEIDSAFVDSCALSGSQLAILIRLPESQKTVTAIFSAQLNDRFWQRLYFSEGEAKLSAEEQALLRELMGSLAQGTEMDRTRSVLEFLTGFLEPGTVLEPFDRQLKKNKHLFSASASSSLFSWTMICDSIGMIREATFTFGDVFITASAPVGDADTRCRGRCGTSCEQWGQWASNQYTQECLAHDICRDQTGEQLGECADEFWAAAAGYTLAPNCF